MYSRNRSKGTAEWHIVFIVILLSVCGFCLMILSYRFKDVTQNAMGLLSPTTTQSGIVMLPPLGHISADLERRTIAFIEKYPPAKTNYYVITGSYYSETGDNKIYVWVQGLDLRYKEKWGMDDCVECVLWYGTVVFFPNGYIQYNRP